MDFTHFNAHTSSAASRVLTLLDSKMRDYGPNNLLEMGMPGVLVRLGDKLNRLKTLTDFTGHVPNHEAIADTWMDVVGYGILGMLLESGELQLLVEGKATPTPDDTPSETSCSAPKTLREARKTRSVYLAGPIDAGGTWNTDLSAGLVEAGYAIFNPATAFVYKPGVEEYMHDVNLEALRRADLVIAYLQHDICTVGTVYEIIKAVETFGINSNKVHVLSDKNYSYLKILGVPIYSSVGELINALELE